jgi:pimeloyl-ACP methyl ester carboxylesterase
MERVNIDGLELEYEMAGTGEPVMFIHGALIADAFKPLLAQPALASSYRLVNYHRRGYARSSRLTRTITVGEQAADCLALMRHLGIERAHVVGHSLGGAIALQLAFDAPNAVATLALMEPAMFVGETAQPYRDSLRQGAANATLIGAAAAVDAFLEARWAGYREPLNRLVPGGFDQAVRDSAGQFAHELPGLLGWEFGEDEARQVAMPALSILGGANDTPGTRFQESHRFLLATLPNAEGAVMPGLEHMLHIQAPEQVAAILAGFWRRHPLTGR